MEQTNFLYVNDVAQAVFKAVLGDGSDKTTNPLEDTSSTPFQLVATRGGFIGRIQVKSQPGNSTPTGLDQDVITGVFLTANEAKAFNDNLFKALGGQKSTPDPLTDGGAAIITKFDLDQLGLLARGGGAAGPIEGGTPFPIGSSPLVGSGSTSGSTNDTSLIGAGGVNPGLAPGIPGSFAAAGLANLGLAISASVGNLI